MTLGEWLYNKRDAFFSRPGRPVHCDTDNVRGLASVLEASGLGGIVNKVKDSPLLGGSFAEKASNVPVVPGARSGSSESSLNVPALVPTSKSSNETAPASISSYPPGPPPDNDASAVIYEQFGREWSNIYHQDNFDGFRLEALKPVTPTMQAAHSLFVGTSSRESQMLYQFGPTYASADGTRLAMSRFGNDGVANFRVISKTPAAEAKISASSSLDQPHRNMVELSYDKTAPEWTLGGKLAWQGTWLLNTSFSQMICRKLTLGGDVTYVTSNGGSIGSMGLRYTPNPDNVLTASVGRQPNFKSAAGFFQNFHSLKMQYFRRVSPRFSVGCEYEFQEDSPTYETALRLVRSDNLKVPMCSTISSFWSSLQAYEYSFRQAKLQGMVDSTGRIAMCAQDASGFGVSATADFPKTDYRIGFMMSLYPQPPDAQQSTVA